MQNIVLYSLINLSLTLGLLQKLDTFTIHTYIEILCFYSKEHFYYL